MQTIQPDVVAVDQRVAVEGLARAIRQPGLFLDHLGVGLARVHQVVMVLARHHAVGHSHRAVLRARVAVPGRNGTQAGKYLDEGEEQAEEAAHDVR
nr:hypothetical protein [Armatimonas sp.]